MAIKSTGLPSVRHLHALFSLHSHFVVPVFGPLFLSRNFVLSHYANNRNSSNRGPNEMATPVSMPNWIFQSSIDFILCNQWFARAYLFAYLFRCINLSPLFLCVFEIIERNWEIFHWSYKIKSFYQQFLRLCNEKPFQYPFTHINMQTMGLVSRLQLSVLLLYFVTFYRNCLRFDAIGLLECGQNCFILSFHQKSKTLLKTRKQFNFNTIPFFPLFLSPFVLFSF